MQEFTEAAREEIRAKMAGLSGSEAKAVALELAESFRVSIGHIYRVSSWTRAVKTRRSRGKIRIPIDPEILKDMVSMSIKTGMASTDVIDIFQKNGEITSDISPAWFNRQLRIRGLSRRERDVDRRPFRRFEASEPGELFQIDATLAEQYYIDDDGSIDLESRASRNKNRPGNRKSRLYIIAAMDDHSRCVYAEFTTGITVNAWLNFEFNCFRQKSDPRFIFHGIPRAIYMDNDVIGKN
jgi:hypothetical protein